MQQIVSLVDVSIYKRFPFLAFVGRLTNKYRWPNSSVHSAEITQDLRLRKTLRGQKRLLTDNTLVPSDKARKCHERSGNHDIPENIHHLQFFFFRHISLHIC